MLLVGLTGGIGAGKSTVARHLAERGAVVLDADAIVRALQEPGTPVFRLIVERFGDDVVASDGTLDRARIAEIVFADPDARAVLEAITHPEVMRKIAARVEALSTGDEVVVLDVPLLAEAGGGEGLDLLVVVEAGEEQRITRLEQDRAMRPDDVRARIAAQATPAERAALADVVITNDGSTQDLLAAVDHLWERIERARSQKAAGG